MDNTSLTKHKVCCLQIWRTIDKLLVTIDISGGMFKSIAEEHAANQAQKRQELKELETKIVDQSLPALSDAIFSELNADSEQIFVNQKEIDKKCRIVKDEWTNFNKELEQWIGMVNKLDKAVKDIGDVRGWSQHIQEEMQAIVAQLENKNQGK